MSEIQKILEAIEALEKQRLVLGDAVVDASLSALRKQLADLQGARGEEQRKLVSILFADLVGFTSLADRMDPEDVRAIQGAYFAAASAPIKEQGGVIEKYIGDAIVAVFGLPRADENDPDRAVMAALKMQAALAELNSHLEKDLGLHLARPLEMRIGINTGTAVVLMKGGDDFDMTGDSVNLASRLQSAAPAGGVLISYDTYRHVRGVFDLQPLEPIILKGKSEPQQIFLVTAAKKRSFRTRKRGVEGIETNMVGRERELSELQGAFAGALEDRELKAITIVAEPGIGKSRLLYEFENWTDLRPERIAVFRGRARMDTQHLPYSLMRDMFAFRFGIQDDDPLPEVWQKLEAGLREFEEELEIAAGNTAPAAPRSATLQIRAHFIGQMLGYDFSASPHLQAARDNPAQVQERAAVYLTEYFRSISLLRPVLILLEDMHWADDSSLSAFGRLASSLVDSPVAIIATTRPALYERRQHWMEGRDFHRRMDLQPLSKRDSRRLVEEVLQKVSNIPEALRELVVTNAEGNPFYVEELIKMLIEEGVIHKDDENWRVLSERLTEIHIPPTLTGVLQARLDALPQDQRVLMQQASVVGRVFWDQALAQLNEGEGRGLPGESIQSGLADLRLKEMVYHRETSVFAGAEELIFKHAMLREVTYASLLKRMRRLYHRMTAEWLVEVTEASGRVDEYTGLIAEHYFQADETLTAADWLTRAGEHALLQGALTEAGDFFERAQRLLPATEGHRRWRVMEGLGAILMNRSYDQTLKTHLEELMALAQSLNDDSHLAEAHLRTALYLAARGENDRAIEEYQAALSSASRAGEKRIEARAMASMAILQARLGERAAAQASAEAALAAALQTGEARILSKVYNNCAVTFIELGDAARAVQYLDRALDYLQQSGDTLGVGNTLSNLGYQYLQLGMSRQAISALERSRSLSAANGAQHDLAFNELNIALATIRAQDAPAAIDILKGAIASLEEQGDQFGRAAGLTYLGLAHEARGGLEAASESFHQAIEIHLGMGIIAYAIDARGGLARCLLAHGRSQEAQGQAALVWQHLSEHGAGGLEFPVWAYLTCAQVFQAVGRRDESLAALSAGYSTLMALAGNISDPEWRSSFLENVPEHRELARMWAEAGISLD